MSKMANKGTTDVVPFDLEKNIVDVGERINAKSRSFIESHIVLDREEKITDGMDVVMVGSVGIKGAAALAEFYEEELKKIWSESFVKNCLEIGATSELVESELLQNDMKPDQVDGELLNNLGQNIKLIYALSESGTFSGLWEMSNYINAGIKVQAYELPIWQEVVEVSEVFGVNPYKLDATGSILIVCNNGASVIKYLTSVGLLASIVGTVSDDKACVITDGETTRYLEPNRNNELKGVSYERRDFKTYRK